MRSFILIFFFFSSVLSSFSTGNHQLKMPDYAEKINQIVYRLSCNANDRQAAKKLIKTYSNALMEYQQEIERLQVEPDSLKWSKTYDLMDELNELSNEILYNSAASRVICDPKVYTGELVEVKQKAVQELYDAGVRSLQTGTKREAKEAYFYFIKADQLSAAFKDVNQKIPEAKNKATINIVVEKAGAYANNKNLYAVRFYETILSKLQSEFLYDRFVNIYSFTEAKQRKINPVDWSVNISFIDIDLEKAASIDNSQFIYVNGVAEIKIFSAAENSDILNKRIPNQYIWKSYGSNDDSGWQTLFDSFSLSMTDQVSGLLSEFIKQSKY